MAEYQAQIKWQKKDYLQLGKAVSNFNKKVNELEQKQGSLGLPELINYQDLKSNIFTRDELNRQLDLLRSFKGDSIEQIIQVNNEAMTVWENDLLKREQPMALERIEQQISKTKESGFGMGSKKMKTLKERRKAIINFDRSLIEKYSRYDYEMKKAKVYQENFMKELENLPDEYEEVKKYLRKIKNPLKFFDETQKSQILQDFFEWYKSPTSYGKFESDEEVAETIVDELQIKIDEKE